MITMLIIYSKRTGLIQGVFTGNLQSIDSLYGDNAEDYSIIWSELFIEEDLSILRNPDKFIVNTEDKTIELLPEYAFNPEDYKIARGRSNGRTI